MATGNKKRGGVKASFNWKSDHIGFQSQTVTWGIIQYPALSTGYTFQDPQRMPETTDGTKSYIHCFFLYIHTCNKV